jgi:hypothetical protein
MICSAGTLYIEESVYEVKFKGVQEKKREQTKIKKRKKSTL